MKFKITVLPGDGVGPEVITEAIKVMAAAGARHGQEFDLSYGKIGGIAIDEFGTALPDETAEMFDGADAILFGAVGGPKWDDTRAAVRPEDAILAMRKNLDAFANLRPVKVYSSLINSSPVKPHLLKGVDIMVVRELTSGLYFGRPKKVWDTSRGRRGVDTLKYTEREIVRILRVGFELAQSRRKLLTSMDKANVLASGRLWREIATEMAEEYSATSSPTRPRCWAAPWVCCPVPAWRARQNAVLSAEASSLHCTSQSTAQLQTLLERASPTL